MDEKTKTVSGCPPSRRAGVGWGRGHKVRNRETEARALALGNRKGGKSDGEKEELWGQALEGMETHLAWLAGSSGSPGCWGWGCCHSSA